MNHEQMFDILFHNTAEVMIDQTPLLAKGQLGEGQLKDWVRDYTNKSNIRAFAHRVIMIDNISLNANEFDLICKGLRLWWTVAYKPYNKKFDAEMFFYVRTHSELDCGYELQIEQATDYKLPSDFYVVYCYPHDTEGETHWGRIACKFIVHHSFFETSYDMSNITPPPSGGTMYANVQLALDNLKKDVPLGKLQSCLECGTSYLVAEHRPELSTRLQDVLKRVEEAMSVSGYRVEYDDLVSAMQDDLDDLWLFLLHTMAHGVNYAKD